MNDAGPIDGPWCCARSFRVSESLALFFLSPRRMKSMFCIHTEVITHPPPSPLFFSTFAHTHRRNHARTTSYLSKPAVGRPYTGHDSASTPHTSHRIPAISIDRAAHSTSSRAEIIHHARANVRSHSHRRHV